MHVDDIEQLAAAHIDSLEREIAAAKRLAKNTAPVQAGRVTEAATRTAGSPTDTPATSAQR